MTPSVAGMTRMGKSEDPRRTRACILSPMPSASTSRRHALAALLLCLVVLLWGFNWPVIKQVVALMPPLWAGVIRTTGAASCLILLQLVRGRLTWPARGDL